jgi:hypothetical protein
MKVEERLQEIAVAIGGEIRSDGMIGWQCEAHRVGKHTCAVIGPFLLRTQCGRLGPWERAWLTAIAFPQMGGRA